MAESDSNAMWASMMSNSNQWMNNPFLYLIFLAMFGRNGFWGGNGNLEQTVADNHNSDLLMGAIKGNADAARTLASNLNCDMNTVTAAINSVKSAVEMGNSTLGSTFQNCCCQNQMATQKMGYENQISNLQQTNELSNRINQLANGVQTGFATVGYETQSQTCAIQKTICDGNQRIVDTLNNHWNAELQQKYNDARLEMSQLNQTNALIAALKTA